MHVPPQHIGHSYYSKQHRTVSISQTNNKVEQWSNKSDLDFEFINNQLTICTNLAIPNWDTKLYQSHSITIMNHDYMITVTIVKPYQWAFQELGHLLPGQLLFYVARNGSVRMLQLLLDEMCQGIPAKVE